METLLFALRAELKAEPPKSAFDVIRMAHILLRDTGADVKISELVERVARGRDGVEGTSDDIIPPDVLQALRVIIQSELVESIANDLKVAPQCKCSLM